MSVGRGNGSMFVYVCLVAYNHASDVNLLMSRMNSTRPVGIWGGVATMR